MKRLHDQKEERLNNLSERFHKIYAENQDLKEEVRDFERIKRVLGINEVKYIIQAERQREQVMKEQQHAEKRKRDMDVR